MCTLFQQVVHSRQVMIMTWVGPWVVGKLVKLVFPGRLHMRPIQWFLKEHCNHTLSLNHLIMVTLSQTLAILTTQTSRNILWCVPNRMWCTLQQSDGQWHLERWVAQQAHKWHQATCTEPSIPSVPTESGRKSPIRQTVPLERDCGHFFMPMTDTKGVSWSSTVFWVENTTSRYVCNQLEHQASKVCKANALSCDWKVIYLYLFPQMTMWNQIVPQLLQEIPKALVNTPLWPIQSWWLNFLWGSI